MEKEEGEIRISDRCQSHLHYLGQMKEGQKSQACQVFLPALACPVSCTALLEWPMCRIREPFSYYPIDNLCTLFTITVFFKKNSTPIYLFLL